MLFAERRQKEALGALGMSENMGLNPPLVAENTVSASMLWLCGCGVSGGRGWFVAELLQIGESYCRTACR